MASFDSRILLRSQNHILPSKFSNNNQHAIEYCSRAKYFNRKKLKKAEFDADTPAFLLSPITRASPSVAFI